MLLLGAILALVGGAITARAASQTWTNAPVNQYWTNILNWNGGAFPGSINGTPNTGNNIDNDVATFNTPIPVSGIGGATSPILIADSTNGSRGLELGGITFDTANCGAYVFQTNLPCSYVIGGIGSNGCFYVCHNNSITMNSTVTNSQTFLVPLFIRLPSSTAGVYNFVNNSANPAATLYINSVTNDSANTRGTVFTLGGSNTGTNTVGYLSKGTTTSGAMGFTKQGTGLWILQNYGGSDFPRQAAVNINDGTLQVLDPGCWGLATPITVNSNGVEELMNVGQTNTTMNGNGTVLLKGSATLASVALGMTVGVTPHLKTTSSSDVLTVGLATAVSGGSATSIINVNGPGTVLLATNSTYVGNWSVNTGVLQIGATSALGTGPNLNVAAGAIVDLTPLGAGVTFNPTTTGIGGSGTGTTVGSTAATIKPDAAGTLDLATGAKNISLSYAPTSFSGDTAHPALYISQGTLNLGGNTFTVNNVSGTPLGTGTYLLIQAASGNVNSTGNLAANVTGSGVAFGNVGTIQVSGGQVNLVVAPYVAKNLRWEGGNPNDNWDVNTTPNWFNGAASSVFNNSDNVEFDSAGASNPVVNLVGALIPGSAVVDTTATNYMLGGSGSISGTASLTKIGPGTLIISNMNDYIGNTVVSNGTVQLAVNNGLSGNGDVTISNIATVDLNGHTAAIGALNGGGTVDTVSGGTPILTIGNNADSGTFSGTIKNTAGTLALTKANTGTETLAGANTYAGATTINAGVLRVANPNALGSGASAVTVNSGTILDVSTNISVASITGVGTVENDSTRSTNELIILGTSSITGVIDDGSGGGGMSVLVNGGTATFNSPSTYSGGTYVASGATLAVQNASPGPVPGSGGIILSNNATLSLVGTGGANLASLANPITTVNNAEASFTDVQIGNEFSGLFFGGITSTDLLFGGTMTVGANADTQESFTNFLGTVIVTNGTVRSFGNPGGGEKTTFDFIGGGGWNARDGGVTVHFGALSGDPSANIFGATGNGVNPQTLDIYIIGEANANSTYSGTITGTNSIVKAGTGTLVLNGGSFPFTNITTVGFNTVTNIGYGSNQMSFVGTTTISNGVLALVAPTELTNSPSVMVASSTAVLDATAMGYISNQFDSDGVTITNSFPVTNSIFEALSGQTVGGVGTLNGLLQADSGSTVSVGLPTGTFNVTSNASLSGGVTINLDDTDAPACGTFAAKSFTINSGATLLVTNVGPGLINGTTFTLFNQHISGFASVTLPATDPTGATNYVWANNLAANGTITLTSGGLPAVNSNPTNIVFAASAGSLTLSWPADHTGWTLQVQTNSLATGISTNWVNVPGSSSTDQVVVLTVQTNGAVFYRLKYP